MPDASLSESGMFRAKAKILSGGVVSGGAAKKRAVSLHPWQA